MLWTGRRSVSRVRLRAESGRLRRSASLAAGGLAQSMSLGRGQKLIDAGVCEDFCYLRVHHRSCPLGGGMLKVGLVRAVSGGGRGIVVRADVDPSGRVEAERDDEREISGSISRDIRCGL
jgi:hypothetical protein